MVYVKVILLLCSCFLIRPTALGEHYSTIGIIVAFFSLYLHLIEHSIKRKLRVNKSIGVVLIASFVFWLFSLLQGTFISSVHMDFVLKAVTTHLVVLTCTAFILSEERTNYIFFRWFIKILVILCASYLTTMLITVFVPLDKLYLFQIYVGDGGYRGVGMTYFPFTVLYSVMYVHGVELPRLLGLFREAGIFQAFLLWSLFNLKNYGLNTWKMKFLLIAGVIGTFSTTGIALMVGVWIAKQILSKKWFLGLLLIPLSFLVLYYAPFIGIQQKSVEYGASITDRQFMIDYGINQFEQHPFGVGMYNADESVKNAGINLISSAYMIGIFGVLLLLAIYFAPLIVVKNKRQYLLAILPLFLTLLISEPLTDAPLVYIMLFANYSGKIPELIRTKEVRPLLRTKFKFKKIVW